MEGSAPPPQIQESTPYKCVIKLWWVWQTLFWQDWEWVKYGLCIYSGRWTGHYYYTPAPPKVEWGYTGFTPMSVHLSVRLSICRQGFRIFFEKLLAQFISYLTFYPYGVSLWALFIFVFLAPFLALWWSNIWPKMGFPERFEKKKTLAQFISYLAFILMGWVSWPLYIFGFLASFSALWWPNIWPKIGFPELFEKKPIGPIHSLIFGPLVAKYLAENGVSATFWRKKTLAQLISYLAFTPMGWVSWPLYIFVFLALFSALWWPNIWPKMGFPELFEKTIGSIHFIPGIYPYGVNLLTLIHFRVPSLIFSPLVAKYLAENGVSATFWKNKHWPN